MNNLSTRPAKKIGVALGGGFIRTAAHIGVLEVLEENGIHVDMVSGCSAGAGIAGAYSCGKLLEIKKSLVQTSPQGYRAIIFEPTMPRKGLLKGERNVDWFAQFVGDKTFADTEIPLVLVATDLQSLKEVVIEEGSIKHAFRACTAVPGIFVPVEQDGKTLVDGGNFNLLPTRQLYERGIDYVIAIDASQPPNKFTRALSWVKQLLNLQPTVKRGPAFEATDKELFYMDIIRRAIHLSSTHIDKLRHTGYRYDILIRPDVVGVRRWHVAKAQYLVEQGRAAALAAIPQIKKDLGME